MKRPRTERPNAAIGVLTSTSVTPIPVAAAAAIAADSTTVVPETAMIAENTTPTAVPPVVTTAAAETDTRTCGEKFSDYYADFQ